MSRSKQHKTVLTRWTVRTYDVWGNAKDGWVVNDVHSGGEFELRIPQTRYNVGTPHEFLGAYPSDSQIRSALGCPRVRIDIDGDDIVVYVNRARDGYPLGELECVSHSSLSPVRVLTTEQK